MKKNILLVCTLALLSFSLSVFSQDTDEEVNRFQKKFLESQIKTELKRLFLNWNEERFLDALYEQGDKTVKILVNSADFAKEMVSKDWVLSENEPRIEKIVFQNLLMADIYLTLKFQHLIDPEKQFEKKVVLRTNLEKEKERTVWKFDLLYIMNLPY